MLNFKYLLILLFIKNLFAYNIEDFNLKKELGKLHFIDSNISLELQTTEGSNIGFYINKKNEVISIKMNYYGESGKRIDYIFFSAENYIIVSENYGYNYPMYAKDSNIILKTQKQYLLKYNEDFNYISMDKQTISEIKNIIDSVEKICKNSQKYKCQTKKLKLSIL